MSKPSDSCQPKNATSVNRRNLLQMMAAGPLALSLPAAAAAGPIIIRPRGSTRDLEPTAGRWKTWLLPNGGAVRPPAPPSWNSAETAAELRELLNLQGMRSDAIIGMVRF